MPRQAHAVKLGQNSGMVLPSVLWMTMLMLVVAANYASAVQLNTRATDNVETATLAGYDAAAGIYVALDRLLSDPAQGSGSYRLELNGNLVEVEFRPETAKISVNEHGIDELTAAFVDAGADLEIARILAARVIDWRDRDHESLADGMEDADYLAAGKPYGASDSRIEDLIELSLMAEVDQRLFASLQDHVTVYSPRLRGLYSLTARVSDASGRQIYVTRAVVQISRQPRNPYRILKWQHHNG